MFEGAKRSQAAIDAADHEWQVYDRARRDLPPEGVPPPNHGRQAAGASAAALAFGVGAVSYEDRTARWCAAVASLLWLVNAGRAALAWRSERREALANSEV